MLRREVPKYGWCVGDLVVDYPETAPYVGDSEFLWHQIGAATHFEVLQAALIANPEHPGEQLERAYCETLAGHLGLSLSYFPTRTGADLTAAFESIGSGTARAICVFADGFAVQDRTRIARPSVVFCAPHGEGRHVCS